MRLLNLAMNPYTGKPYSQKYFEILDKRRQLPVWEQKDQFLEMIRNTQVMVLVGETGSGKTTQVSRKSDSLNLPRFLNLWLNMVF